MRNVPNSNYTVYVTATIEKIVLETGNQNSFEQLKDVCGDISVKPGRICLDPEGRENHSPTPIKFTGGRTWKLKPKRFIKFLNKTNHEKVFNITRPII